MVVAAILAGVNNGVVKEDKKVDLVEQMPAEDQVIFSGVVQKCPFADGTLPPPSVPVRWRCPGEPLILTCV